MYEWSAIVIIILVLFIIIYSKWSSNTELTKKTMFSFDEFKHKSNVDLSFRKLTPSYQVYEIPDVLSTSECYQLCFDAKPLLSSSPSNTFQGCILTTPLSSRIQHIASSLSSYPISHMEPLIITKYIDGDELPFHFDMLISSHFSTRVCTLLFYLNDDFFGGEIEFCNLQTLFTAKIGKALFFWVAHDNKPIYESKYKARPVYLKTKWMATQYIHSEPINED